MMLIECDLLNATLSIELHEPRNLERIADGALNPILFKLLINLR